MHNFSAHSNNFALYGSLKEPIKLVETLSIQFRIQVIQNRSHNFS